MAEMVIDCYYVVWDISEETTSRLWGEVDRLEESGHLSNSEALAQRIILDINPYFNRAAYEANRYPSVSLITVSADDYPTLVQMTAASAAKSADRNFYRPAIIDTSLLVPTSWNIQSTKSLLSTRSALLDYEPRKRIHLEISNNGYPETLTEDGSSQDIPSINGTPGCSSPPSKRIKLSHGPPWLYEHEDRAAQRTGILATNSDHAANSSDEKFLCETLGKEVSTIVATSHDSIQTNEASDLPKTAAIKPLASPPSRVIISKDCTVDFTSQDSIRASPFHKSSNHPVKTHNEEKEIPVCQVG